MDPKQEPASTAAARRAPSARKGDIFGIPLRELGWFTCLLIGVASGFAAFFAATFLAIVTLLVLNSAGHHIDYAITYRRIGLPIGLVVGVVALGYLGTLWSKRHLSAR